MNCFVFIIWKQEYYKATLKYISTVIDLPRTGGKMKKLSKWYDTFMLVNRRNTKVAILLFLFLFLFVLSWIMDHFDPGGNAYTHLFYIPVIICAIWFGKYVFFITVPMTIIHLIFEFYRLDEWTYSPLLRVSTLNLIAVVVTLLVNQIKILNSNLKQQILYIKQINDSVSDVMGRCDMEGNIQYVTPSVRKIFGYNEDEIVGLPFLKFIDPLDYQDMLQSMIIARTSTEDFRKECRIVSKNQESKWTEVVISPILNDSICIGSVFICTDITERKKHHDIIIEAIHKDELTGLYNRRYLDQRMEELLIASQSGSAHFSILLLDIDFFKKVNDNFGHPVGDVVLKKVADLIRETVRVSDVVGRFGGEEFMVLLPETEVFGAISTAEKIRIQIQKFLFETVKHITISIGIVTYKKENTYQELYDKVDQALYLAKGRGRNRISIYSKFDYKTSNLKELGLSSGNSTIDFQHQNLLSMFESILKGYMENESNDKITKSLSKIKAELIKHFSSEEYLLSEKKYSKLEEHKNIHYQLLFDLDQIQNLVHKYYEVDFAVILVFLCDIIVTHIETEDKDFFEII